MGAEWELYILLCGDGTYYTGIARDADRRLEMHMGGKGAKYTRGRGPLAAGLPRTLPGSQPGFATGAGSEKADQAPEGGTDK